MRLLFVYSLLLSACFLSCKKDDKPSNLTGITAFSIKGLNIGFTVDQAALKIYNTDSLPYKSDVSALVAEFETVANTSVTVDGTVQVSGVTANNFTNNVTYKTTAQDGVTTRLYTVQVNVARLDPNGLTWQQISPNAGWGPYKSSNAIAFNSKFWLFGATLPNNNSIDAGAYTATDPAASWSRLTATDNEGKAVPSAETQSLAVFNNKLWLVGGHAPGPDAFAFDYVTNKIWSSTDGTSWTVTTPSSAFSIRHRVSTAVLNNKLWIIGGNGYPAFGTGTGTPYNDVWSSADGTTWTQATAAAGFTARTYPAVFVYDNKLWVAGGYTSSGAYLNDIWNSADGATWTQVTTATSFTGRYGHKVVAYNDQLFLIGGEDASGVLNDLWVSEDKGVNWTRIQGDDQRALPANFPAHTQFSLFVYDNAIWIIGGLGAKDANNKYTNLNDVWKGKLH